MKGARVYLALTWSLDLQELTLVNTGIRLEHRRGFTLGVIKGMEWLCLLCHGCRILTAVVSAWIQCRHCDETFTRLNKKHLTLWICSQVSAWNSCGSPGRPAKALKHWRKAGLSLRPVTPLRRQATSGKRVESLPRPVARSGS